MAMIHEYDEWIKKHPEIQGPGVPTLESKEDYKAAYIDYVRAAEDLWNTVWNSEGISGEMKEDAFKLCACIKKYMYATAM